MFKIEADDVGPLTKIRIGHDNKGGSSGWFLDNVHIQRHALKGSKRLKKRKQLLTATVEILTWRPYRSRAWTRDRGTCTGVHTFWARFATVAESIFTIALEKKWTTLTLRKFAPIDSRQGSTVSVDREEIEDYYFPCNRWLARDEDDREIVRELLACDQDGRPISGLEGEYSATL